MGFVTNQSSYPKYYSVTKRYVTVKSNTTFNLSMMTRIVGYAGATAEIQAIIMTAGITETL